jgi:seryl-tRNA synthetase
MPAQAPYSLKDMFDGLAHFQQVVGRVHSGLRNPDDKAKLGELLEQLQKARAEAEENVPAVLQEKLQKSQKAQAEMQELKKQFTQKREELAEQRKKTAQAVASMPSPPSLPEVPIDPKLGQDLRIELLKAYGGLKIKEKLAWE